MQSVDFLTNISFPFPLPKANREQAKISAILANRSDWSDIQAELTAISPKCSLQPANVIYLNEAIHIYKKNKYINNVFLPRFMQIKIFHMKVLCEDSFSNRGNGNSEIVHLLTLFNFFTPSSPSPTPDGGDYELVMFKNGVRVTKYCGWRGKCIFKVR